MEDEELKRVEATYRRLARRWAWSIVSVAGFQGSESRIRRRAVARLELRPGDAVLDLACGRGSNLPYLWPAVGPKGRVLGVDYSSEMLAGAQELVRARGWANVELARADAADMAYAAEFDAALCTNALSVIPRWEQAMRRMVVAVRCGGRVVVLDGQLGKRWRRLGNPYARLFARVVAADLGRDLPGEFHRLIPDARKETMMLGTYFVISGATPTKDEG